MAFRIFIGWDSREAEAADVLKFSLLQNSSIPLEITMLSADYCRERGYNPLPDRPASTEFAYSRFLIPWLCRFDGLALFLDCDMLCLGDIAEVAALPMADLDLRCTQHNYTPRGDTKMWGEKQVGYPRKLWSSFMLMDCARLACWGKEFVERASGQLLHRFTHIPDERLGAIDLAWNEVYELTPATKCFHWTEGGPWLENYRECHGAEAWNRWRRKRMAWLESSSG